MLQNGPDSVLVLRYVLGCHRDASFNGFAVPRQTIVEKLLRAGLGNDDWELELSVFCAKVVDFDADHPLSVADHGEGLERLTVREEPFSVAMSVEQLQGSWLDGKGPALAGPRGGLVDDAEGYLLVGELEGERGAHRTSAHDEDVAVNHDYGCHRCHGDDKDGGPSRRGKIDAECPGGS